MVIEPEPKKRPPDGGLFFGPDKTSFHNHSRRSEYSLVSTRPRDQRKQQAHVSIEMKASSIIKALPIILTGICFSAHSDDSTHNNIERGKYIATISGCIHCHTDTESQGKPLAGGKELKSRFGTFYAPNITPDPKTGIGNWSDDEFIRALQYGISPKGEHYYPAFPYTSFTRMTREDILSVKRYLDSMPAIENTHPEHIVSWPISDRSMLEFWKRVNFTPLIQRRGKHISPEWNRGAYLSEVLIHCGECHTPRFSSGGSMHHRHLAGAYLGAQSERVPNITSHVRDGIGSWSKNQIAAFLATGITPQMRQTTGSMKEVIDEYTSKLDAYDIQAIAEYLTTVPPIPDLSGSRSRQERWWLEPSD